MTFGVFSATNPRTFLGVSAGAVLLAGFGGLIVSRGTENAMLAILVLAVLFAVTAARSVRLRDFGVSSARWVRSAAVSAVVVSLAAAALVTLMIIVSDRNPTFYQDFASFTVQASGYEDVGGVRYASDGPGMPAGTLALTGLCVFFSFLMGTVAGAALGAVFGARGTRACVLAALGGFVAAYGVGAVFMVLDVNVAAPWPGVPMFAVVVCVVSGLVLAWALKKERRPMPAVVPELPGVPSGHQG
ncbi:hypothetical protein [Corynebacterium sp.]|uniref:hypothetical protein n=1 Tax=Corynebacterium sp. TaxID=1720 RepID=UPI002637C983|nr:hypothetical protein [Corynebacterium sp.]